jgi:hypothetical protein
MKRRAAHDGNDCHDDGLSHHPFDENGQEVLDASRTRGIEDYSQMDESGNGVG